MDPDDLYTLRNLFWLGHYQLAINEANGLNRLNNALTVEKDEFVYRSYMLLGQHNILQGEINPTSPNTPLGLQAVRLLSDFMVLASSPNEIPGKKEEYFETLNVYMSAPGAAACKVLAVVAATMWLHEDNAKEALKCVISSTHIEHKVLSIQILLRMNQFQLAEQKLQQLRAQDGVEDTSLYKLASCWLILQSGDRGKFQEAVYKYEELVDKYTGSALLLNGLASAHILMGNYSEAETLLNDALTKPSAETESLANLIVVQQHLQRPVELVNRTIAQLRTKCKGHPLLQALATFEGSFERLVAV